MYIFTKASIYDHRSITIYPRVRKQNGPPIAPGQKAIAPLQNRTVLLWRLAKYRFSGGLFGAAHISCTSVFVGSSSR